MLTLFSQDGIFNLEANSYLFYLKAVKKAEDLSPCAQALRAYYQFLEYKGLRWDEFPPVKRLKPTYLYRSHLLKQIKQGELAHSTASVRMNQIVNYYKWLNDKLVQVLARIDNLEYENAKLREELAQLKRNKITTIR